MPQGNCALFCDAPFLRVAPHAVLLIGCAASHVFEGVEGRRECHKIRVALVVGSLDAVDLYGLSI